MLRVLSKVLLPVIIIALLVPATLVAQQKATWIWYPGDYDIWLANHMQNRRTERGSFFPPFWRLDNHYILMDFHKDVNLAQPEEIDIFTQGTYNVKIDSKLVPGFPKRVTIPAGKHRINIKVYNNGDVPAIFVQGKTIVSDSSWQVTYEDKEWIDASGKVSDQSGTQWLSAGYWNFNDPASLPSKFTLTRQPMHAVKTMRAQNNVVADFGKETFGFIRIHGLKGKGNLALYYGESQEEAMATETCETLDRLVIDQLQQKDSVMPLSKAFRFVNLRSDGSVQFDSVSMLYEYLPVDKKGAFRCNDEQLNKIWDVATYTLQLNTREFFIDGIKRDRWIWSGDAYQSYLMNYYLFFDMPSVTRTLFALRGKDPVTSHINTIMDYTFYWFLGIYDYYLYSGDKTFIQQCYPRMQSLMDYCLSRRNAAGLMEGLSGDWVFIDWADGLSKKGEVSFEQLLLCRSLETMALCAAMVNDGAGATTYKQLAADLRAKLFSIYWSNAKHAFVHSRVNGAPTDHVTRYTNMFAIFFGYLTAAQQQDIKKYVLLNDSIQKITTPYMRFYELEALCAMGEQSFVLKEMKDYWGGMLNLGATSFWEKYDPTEKGTQHLAMYGRPFGRSLCHAWGASPIYLLGKYYLGVRPTAPAYSAYVVEPVLGGLQWMEGAVPTPNGPIAVYCSTNTIKVKAGAGTGTLRFTSKSKPVSKTAVVVSRGNNVYEVGVEAGKEVEVKYQVK
jgi:alpha-L-rhamnosidase